MSNDSWTAHWLWAAGENQRYRRYTNTYVLCRSELELPATPERAIVRVTADTRYRLWVNGERVNRGPARGYPASQPYDELDLAPYLRSGANVLGIQAHCIGDYTFQSEFAGRPGVLLDGAAEFSEHGPVRLDTHPAQWQVLELSAYRRQVSRSSIQTGWQEDCDLRQFPDGWLEPGFDTTGWTRAHSLGPHPQPPWLELEARGLPLLKEVDRWPSSVVGIFSAAQATGWESAEDLAAPLGDEAWQPDPEAASIDGRQVTIPPRGDGQAVAIVYDLGLTCLGFPELEIFQAAEGSVVELAYAERQLESGFPATRPPETIQPRLVDRFHTREGYQTIEVFNPRGYRYLAVIVRQASEPVVCGQPKLNETLYPIAQRGKLTTGESKLDRIWQIGVDTLQRNMTDAYTDCPWREQAQWWGDARVEFWVNAYSLGDSALLARGVRQGRQSQLANGLVYGVFPGQAFILPDYNFVWLETIWDHYLYTGSEVLLYECADAMRANLKWFRDQTDETGLLTTPEGTWLFLDWAPLFRQQYSTVYNLRYLQALATATQIFSRIGDHVSADACVGRGMMAALALTQHVFNPETGRWHDGWDAAKGERVEQVSAHAQALAIQLGLQPESHDTLCREVLLPSLRRATDEFVEPSPFFSAHVMETLAERGYHEEVVDVIRQRWGDWVDQGHPTWPEEWDEGRSWNLSLCHAWSASPTYLLSQILLGVRSLAPGWQTIHLAPRRCGLTQVQGTVPSPRGEIEVQWRVSEGTWTVEATLPEGVRAIVDLEDGQRHEVEGGEHVWEVRV